MLSDKTALVSVMLANNEIGTLQPVAEIAELCRSRGIVLHSDAAQAVGKIPVDVANLGVDLLSISAHKLYGPQGIGALYIGRDCLVTLRPLLFGGAQQDGRRAGTVPVMLCAGLAAACKIARERMTGDYAHALRLRTLLLDALRAEFPDLVINGDLEKRLPGNLNIRLRGYDADSLLARLRGQLAASTGSACNSGLIEPSYVLLALGLSLEEANSSIRFGLGRFSTVADIERAAAALVGQRVNRNAKRRNKPVIEIVFHHGLLRSAYRTGRFVQGRRVMLRGPLAEPGFRGQFSGHETFPLRQLWLRKAFDAVAGAKPARRSLFTDPAAIITFGSEKIW